MSSLAHPNPDRLRRRGGQPGNTNALRSGKRSKRVKAERMAARRAEWQEERRKFEAWAATIPPIDYAGICAALERERLELEAAEDARAHHLKMIL
jgi:hypothetical protein